jgi:hypothetical protein
MPFSRHVLLVPVFLIASCLAAMDESAARPKTPVPDAAAQQTAKKAAGELFADRFKQAKTTAEKTALATDMMDAASKVQAGSADQYVLLKIARDVAAGTGDAATALQAVERLLGQFDEPAAELIGETLLTAARQASASAQHKAVAEAALTFAGKLADADQYETALRLCEAARSSAQRAKLYPLAKELTARIEEINRQQLLSEEYRKALSVLDAKPTDPAANLAAGWHLCFVKGNWDRGVPMLALGSDEALRAAAIKDLRGANSADEQAVIGDAWWDLAETRQGEERDTLRLRAGFWYRQAEPQLAGGLAGLKVKQRLKEIAVLGQRLRPLAGSRSEVVLSADSLPVGEVRRFGPDMSKVNAIALAPAGDVLLGGCEDGHAAVWEIGTGKELARRKIDGRIFGVAISRDGKLAACACEDTHAHVLNLNTLEPIGTIGPTGSWATRVAFATDTRNIIVATEKVNPLQIWGIEARRSLASLPSSSGNVRALCLSPDGQYVLAGFLQGGLCLYEAGTGKIVRSFKGQPAELSCAAFCPDGRRILSGGSDKIVYEWDLTTGTPIRRFEGNQAEVTGVSVSTDGIWLASSAKDGAVRLWNLNRGNLVGAWKLEGEARGVAFLPDPRFAVFIGGDGKIHLWKLPVPKPR